MENKLPNAVQTLHSTLFTRESDGHSQGCNSWDIFVTNTKGNTDSVDVEEQGNTPFYSEFILRMIEVEESGKLFYILDVINMPLEIYYM